MGSNKFTGEIPGGTIADIAGFDFTVTRSNRSAEFNITDWRSLSPKTLPVQYFGIAGSGNKKTTDADIKDINLVEIPAAASSKVTVNASTANSVQGSVTINNNVAENAEIDEGSSVTFKATAASGYKFVNWTDAQGNELSQSAEYTVKVFENMAVTANFEALASGEAVWNFAEYADTNAVKATAVQNVQYQGLAINIGSDDTITNNGLYWSAKGTQDETGTASRFIHYRPTQAGTLTFTIKAGTVDSKSTPRLYFNKGTDSSATQKNQLNNVTGAYHAITAENTDTKLSYTLEANQDYVFWTYIYGSNRKSAFTISNISFTPTTAQ